MSVTDITELYNYHKQRQGIGMGNPLVSEKEDAHRMPANICSMHCRASTFLRSGFWRVTSKVASTISAMIGFWRTSPWTRTF